MVLTDRQRSDLHGGIYEYFLSRGSDFAQVAEALARADPDSCKAPDSTATDESNGKKTTKSTTTPILEKKWTAVPRLQRRVLELERQLTVNAKIHAHRTGGGSDGSSANPSGGIPARERRLLPRPPATHTLQSHSAVVTTVSVHPVYTMAASGSEDGTIKLWDHESGEYLRTLRGHTNVVTCVDFSPKGGYLASTSTDLSIKIWDVKEFTCVRTLRGHDHTISCVRFVPPTGAKIVVTASRDSTVKFWDLETGFCDATVSDHSDWVRCLANTTTSSLALVATSGNDRTIYVYNAHEKREKVAELRGHDHVVESLSFLCSSLLPKKGSAASRPTTSAAEGASSSWEYLASGSRDRTVRLWTVANGGSCLMTFRAHENWVRGVLIHPSGNHILSCGDDRSIRVFDIKSNRCLRTIEDAHPHFVTSMAMHYTLPILVSGGVDHAVKCWQLD
ncbi:platelet-activating factor acetylhydrolase beta subunit-like protein [Thalassiosira pseudonana CCMP1335]